MLSEEERRARRAESQRKYKAAHPEKVAEVDRRYKTSPAGKAMKARSRERYRAKYPEKRRAHDAVMRAVAAGRLVPQPCLVCGSGPTKAHHAWGYEPENYLRVIWLCHRHHTDAHREERAA